MSVARSQAPGGAPEPGVIAAGIGGLTVRIAAPVDPDALTREGVERQEASPGYWAHLWPSARELARHLARSTLVGPGVRILEVGCGLGLCGIVAALRGADVTMTDFNPDAVSAAKRNADLNGVTVKCERFDWNDAAPGAWVGAVDLVIASDVLYEAGGVGVTALAGLVRTLGCPAMISDPARPQSSDAESAFRALGLRAWATPANSGRIIMVSGEA